MSRPRDDACWFTRGQQRQALAKVNRGFSEADGPTDSQPPAWPSRNRLDWPVKVTIEKMVRPVQ